MRYRELGESGIRVSEIGFGALGIGGLSADAASYGPTDDAESLAALQRASDLGVTFFDTSPDYGDGKSEELLGRAFGSRRDRVVIASKVGFVSLSRPNDHDAIRASLEPHAIRTSVEGTLRRLGGDYVDLLQLHSPPLDIMRNLPETSAMLERLREEGKIRSWGISLRSPAEGLDVIREFQPAAIQLNLNMIDQRALESGLLDEAAKQGVAVIARTPLAYGFLSGRYADLRFDPRDHRRRWPREQLERWAGAPALFASLNEGKDRTMAQLALKFCLSHPAVSTVIAGMQRVREVAENAAAGGLPPLTPGEVTAIRSIYRQHEFFVSKKS